MKINPADISILNKSIISMMWLFITKNATATIITTFTIDFNKLKAPIGEKTCF